MAETGVNLAKAGMRLHHNRATSRRTPSIPYDAVAILAQRFSKEALKNYCARSCCVEIRLKMLIYNL